MRFFPKMEIHFRTLVDKRIRFCERLGRERTDRRRGVPNKNNLAKSDATYVTDVERDVAALMCEAAGMLFFSPCHWDIGERPGLADIEDFIDVKRGRTARHRLLMYLDGRLDWAYVLVCDEDHPHYWLRGWQWGKCIKELGKIEELQPGRPCYVLEHEHLRPMSELLAEVRRRQQVRGFIGLPARSQWSQ